MVTKAVEFIDHSLECCRALPGGGCADVTQCMQRDEQVVRSFACLPQLRGAWYNRVLIPREKLPTWQIPALKVDSVLQDLSNQVEHCSLD